MQPLTRERFRELMGMAQKLGWDLHRICAAEMLGCHYVDVTEEQRRQAKTMNFPHLYGDRAPVLQLFPGEAGHGTACAKLKDLAKAWHAMEGRPADAETLEALAAIEYEINLVLGEGKGLHKPQLDVFDSRLILACRSAEEVYAALNPPEEPDWVCLGCGGSSGRTEKIWTDCGYEYDSICNDCECDEWAESKDDAISQLLDRGYTLETKLEDLQKKYRALQTEVKRLEEALQSSTDSSVEKSTEVAVEKNESSSTSEDK